MNRRLCCWVLLSVMMLTAGCSKARSPNPGEWDRAQVEAWVREKMSLTELQLSADGEKSYTATGRDAAGKEYEIRVKQTDNGIKCEHTWTAGTGKGSGQFSQSYSSSKSGP